MALQEINLGTPNSGTGDSLYTAGTKINENFEEIYGILGGTDSDADQSLIRFYHGNIVFEGSNKDNYETTFGVAEPTADRTVIIPNSSGNLVLDTHTQTLTNKTLTSPIMTSPKISTGTYVYTIGYPTLTFNRNLSLPTPSVDSDDTFVTEKAPSTLTNKTLTLATLNTPIVDKIVDNTSNGLLSFVKTTSAVNCVQITNATNGNGPTLDCFGTNTNINLNIKGKNTGKVILGAYGFATTTITDTGTLPDNASLYLLNKDSSLTVTVPNGGTVGEVKKFININTGTATLTINGSGVQVAPDESLSIVWGGSKWYNL